MANIIDGKLLASKIMKKLKEEVNSLKQEEICPKLAVIMVGNDKASEVYVRNKSKACNEVGIEFEEFILKEDITMQQLLAIIEKIYMEYYYKVQYQNIWTLEKHLIP